MSAPLTQYATKNAVALMNGFHQLGSELLKDLVQYSAEPQTNKSLRTFKMKEAAEMVGRSSTFLKSIESDKTLVPIREKNGNRRYTLELINKIRDKADTRYKRPQPSKTMVVAVSNFKGGVAKSTTSLHLAHKCALDGLRVLAIDLDPQGTFTLGFGYVPDVDLSPSDTIRDALLGQPDNIKKVIKKTYFDGISIIPGNLGLSEIEILLTNLEEQKKHVATLGMPDQRLKKAIDIVAEEFDVIILDCGPNLGMLTINAVTAANGLLVPIPPMMSDLGSFVTFTGTLGALFDPMHKNFDFFRILLTKHPESKESKALDIMMRERFGAYMVQKHIVNSVEIEKASSLFRSVYETEKNSTPPYKRAIEHLDDVFNEIIEAFKMTWEAQALEHQESTNE